MASRKEKCECEPTALVEYSAENEPRWTNLNLWKSKSDFNDCTMILSFQRYRNAAGYLCKLSLKKPIVSQKPWDTCREYSLWVEHRANEWTIGIDNIDLNNHAVDIASMIVPEQDIPALKEAKITRCVGTFDLMMLEFYKHLSSVKVSTVFWKFFALFLIVILLVRR
jgi:hypothetical protein